MTEYLINEHGFIKLFKPMSSIIKDATLPVKSTEAINKFSCVLRIGDVHYLYFSEEYKYFTLSVRYERPKGKPGGGLETERNIMIPKIMLIENDARKFIESIT